MNFYKSIPLDKGYRYFKVNVGDKYSAPSNTETGCIELKNELYSIGVKSKVGCNNGMWSVAIIDIPKEDIFVRIPLLVSIDSNIKNNIYPWRDNF